MHTCERCWIQVSFAPARVCGVMLQCWFGRKMGGLHFCIDFHCLNAHMKDSYPLPRIQEVLESLVGAGHFLCLDLKS